VTFDYKEYRMGRVKKQMTLTQGEFMLRFAFHILPNRFVKIRHYGFLSSTWKRKKTKAFTRKIASKGIRKSKKEAVLPKWPYCKTGNLYRIAVFDQRGPPACYLGGSQNSIACKS
jgi:hypothetical protein